MQVNERQFKNRKNRIFFQIIFAIDLMVNWLQNQGLEYIIYKINYIIGKNITANLITVSGISLHHMAPKWSEVKKPANFLLGGHPKETSEYFWGEGGSQIPMLQEGRS